MRSQADAVLLQACGFEMLYARTAPQPRLSEESASDPSSEAGYAAYIQGLTKAGFFEGELEGSAKWQARHQLAVAGWRKNKSKRWVEPPNYNSTSKAGG